MNTYGIDNHQLNYIKFLETTRTEMYYCGIEPTIEILKNEFLRPEEKLDRIQLVVDEFMKVRQNWSLKEFGITI